MTVTCGNAPELLDGINKTKKKTFLFFAGLSLIPPMLNVVVVVVFLESVPSLELCRSIPEKAALH